MKTKIKFLLKIVIILLVLPTLHVKLVHGNPIAPSITAISNSTKSSGNGQIFNGTATNVSLISGGYIFTIDLDASTQNNRWKGYVGNVSGSLVLDDANDNTLYSWSLNTSITGQVFATRKSTSVTWTSINCSNRSSHLINESILMNHTNPNDNITATFSTLSNNEFYVGNVKINASTCPTTNMFVDDSAPSSDEFEEVALFDGSSVVYAAIINNDQDGYQNNDATYDFEMIVPERGLSGWVSSTAYYFYVELS